MTQDKIKCVVSENGTIIPIHNISLDSTFSINASSIKTFNSSNELPTIFFILFNIFTLH